MPVRGESSLGVEETPVASSQSEELEELKKRLAEAENAVNILNGRLERAMKMCSTLFDMYIQNK